MYKVDVRSISRGAPLGLTKGDQGLEVKRVYRKGEVKEYISNPVDFLNRSVRNFNTGEIIGKISDILLQNNDEEDKNIFVKNPSVAKYMPHNSIIVYVGDQNEKPVIAYPFFPPHISLPLKAGEQVWLLEEGEENPSFYYWMCRVVTDRQIDDLNHTNIDRSVALRELSNKYEKDGNISDDELLYPASASEKFNNVLIPPELTLSGIQAESVSFMEEFTSEPVPRTFGKCSDLLLQGSNNSTIQFTTEKFKNTSDLESNVFLGKDATDFKGNVHTPLAGTIDMFVGKEKERLRALALSSNPEDIKESGNFNVRLSKRLSDSSILETYEASKIDEYELGKENSGEGNDSPRNVFSRLYLSMNTLPDASFDFLNADFEDDLREGPSAILYSENVRLYAESSLRAYNYTGNNLIDISDDGSITLQTGEGEEAAKIILSADGNIVIKPGSKGVLYLGGDESDISGVAVSVSTLTPPTEGLTDPTEPSITTSMGGHAFLGDPVSGYTSSKVMIKV
jgi:hypothetical protein